MSIKENAQTIAENVPKVYQAGREDICEAFRNEIFDTVQQNGSRTNYNSAFADAKWDDVTFKPIYDISATDARYMFRYSQITDLKKLLTENNITLTTSGTSLLYFADESAITHCPAIGNSNLVSADNCFRLCKSLHTVDALSFGDNCSFGNTFWNCTNLVNLTLNGSITKNGFNVSWSKSLSHDSLLGILNALKDYSEDASGTSWVVTLGTANLNKLTDEEKAIATQKGWTIA